MVEDSFRGPALWGAVQLLTLADGPPLAADALPFDVREMPPAGRELCPAPLLSPRATPNLSIRYRADIPHSVRAYQSALSAGRLRRVRETPARSPIPTRRTRRTSRTSRMSRRPRPRRALKGSGAARATATGTPHEDACKPDANAINDQPASLDTQYISIVHLCTRVHHLLFIVL